LEIRPTERAQGILAGIANLEEAMQLTVDKSAEVTVVTFHQQQLDVTNAEDIRKELAPLLQDCRKLVLDVSRVRFVDSRGCGVILSCLKQLVEKGGDLKLCGVTGAVRTIFELVRMHRVCQILPTREEAVRAFQG
jgi:anti-sigma B factor antagonist